MQCVMKECEYWTQANHGKHGNMFTGVVHVFVFPSGNSCKAHALFICMCAALFPHPPRSQLLNMVILDLRKCMMHVSEWRSQPITILPEIVNCTRDDTYVCPEGCFAWHPIGAWVYRRRARIIHLHVCCPLCSSSSGRPSCAESTISC